MPISTLFISSLLLLPLYVRGQLLEFSQTVDKSTDFYASSTLFWETELTERVDALRTKTVFVPTNRALLQTLQDLGYKGNSTNGDNKISAMIEAYWKLDEAKVLNLTHVFSYHVSGRQLSVQQFQSAGNVTTDRGAISWNPNTQFINHGGAALPNPKFVSDWSKNIKIVGGYIHGIDRVLFPSNFNFTAARAIIESIRPPFEQEAKAEPSTEAEEESSCFPASAIVHLADGRHIEMGHLKEGMPIRVSQHTYSPVFLFSHKNLRVKSRFIRFTTKSAHSITLTPSHYLYANGRLSAASSVRLGDFLHILRTGSSPVVSIENVSDYGLIVPHALHSNDLFVNGVLASSYTTSIHPRVAHLLLAPLRALVHAKLTINPLGRFLYNGGGRWAKCFPRGPAAF